MNVTGEVPVFVRVEQSNEWGGTMSWTMSGTDVKHIHNDNPNLPYFDQTTTITREGSGQVQLIAIPGRVNPAVALLDPSSIVATDHVKIVVVTITRGGGCESTKTETTEASGNHSEFPTNPSVGKSRGSVDPVRRGERVRAGVRERAVGGDGHGHHADEHGVYRATMTSCRACRRRTRSRWTLGPEMAGGFDRRTGCITRR